MHVARGMLDYNRLPRELACMWLVQCLTTTDSRSSWRACGSCMLVCIWLVQCLTTALNHSSSHHSSCVRGSSGPSMCVCAVSILKRFKRFKHVCLCCFKAAGDELDVDVDVGWMQAGCMAGRMACPPALSAFLEGLSLPLPQL